MDFKRDGRWVYETDEDGTNRVWATVQHGPSANILDCEMVARLFAASPQLLAACELALDDADKRGDSALATHLLAATLAAKGMGV